MLAIAPLLFVASSSPHLPPVFSWQDPSTSPTNNVAWVSYHGHRIISSIYIIMYHWKKKNQFLPFSLFHLWLWLRPQTTTQISFCICVPHICLHYILLFLAFIFTAFAYLLFFSILCLLHSTNLPFMRLHKSLPCIDHKACLWIDMFSRPKFLCFIDCSHPQT